MKSSAYFRRTLYSEQNPSALEYWRGRAHSLFVTDVSQSWVDAYFNTSLESVVDTLVPARQKETKPIKVLRFHTGTVEEKSQPIHPFSVDEGLRCLNGVQRGLSLTKLQDESELRQYLSVR